MPEDRKAIGRPRTRPTRTVRVDDELLTLLEQLAEQKYSKPGVEANQAVRLYLVQEGLLPQTTQ